MIGEGNNFVRTMASLAERGVDAPLRLVDIPLVTLVHEVLADQVEVSQILAHRDSHSIPVIGDPPPLP